MKHAGFVRALALALSFAGCGGGGKRAGDTTTTTVQAEIILELGELTLFEGDDPILKIHADGKTEYAEMPGKWQAGPTLKQDGTVEHDGKAVAKLNGDGTIVDLASNAKLPLIVTADKLTVNDGGKEMSIELAANGSLSVIGEDPPTKPVRVDGAKTPGQRKAALVLLAIMRVGGSEGPPPGAPGGDQAPTTAPPAAPPG